LRSAVCQQDRCTTVTAPGMAIGATMKQPRTTVTTRGPVTPEATVVVSTAS
jgi:hypothetical protein